MGWRPYVAWRLAVRLIPAAVLLWAGMAKALDPQGSVLAVGAYEVLPTPLVRVVAALLPWVEIALAVLLVLGLFVRFAGIATAVLAAMFVAAMSQAKARGLEIDCGCFGGGGPGAGVSGWDIARDVPIVLAGVYLAARPHGPLQLDRPNLEVGDGEDREADQVGASARAR